MGGRAGAPTSSFVPLRCRDGGIGRRDGFKIRFPQGSKGSTPFLGTSTKPRVQATVAEERLSAARDARSDLAAALLPPLLHRIQNTTQLLLALRSLIGRAGARLPEELGDSLAAAARAADEQGWMIGLLSRSMGSDVLLAREERDALRISLQLVADWARQSQGTLELPDEWPPLALAADAPASAELALEVLVLVWISLDPAQVSRLCIVRAEGALELALEAAACERAVSRFAGSSLARRGARLSSSAGHWTLSLPDRWFELTA